MALVAAEQYAMAKVSVEFDTVSKEMVATIDGKAVADVCYVSFCGGYGDPDEFSCCVESSKKDEEHDMRLMTRLCASETAGAKHPEAAASEFPGFVQVPAKGAPLTKVAAQIHEFFNKR